MKTARGDGVRRLFTTRSGKFDYLAAWELFLGVLAIGYVGWWGVTLAGVVIEIADWELLLLAFWLALQIVALIVAATLVRGVMRLLLLITVTLALIATGGILF